MKRIRLGFITLLSFFLPFSVHSASVGILHSQTTFGAALNSDYSNRMNQLVQLAGHTGTIITDFANFNLSSVDILWFIDGDNSNVETEFSNRAPQVRSFISNGGYLVMQNRTGTASGAYLSLLGTSGTAFDNNGNDVTFVDSGFISNGPNGSLSNTDLDNQWFTYHSYVNATSVSGLVGYQPILVNAADSSQLISFYFRSGTGGVYFDTTPGNTFLDYPTDPNVSQTKYLMNVLDVTSGMIPEPSAGALLMLGAGGVFALRRLRRKAD